MVEKEVLVRAINELSGIDSLYMDGRHLAEDIFVLTNVFDAEHDFLEAMANTARAIRQLIKGSVEGTPLDYSYQGWLCYRYQHTRDQGVRADMRIVYAKDEAGIRVLGFGHRRRPNSVYWRLLDR